MYDYREGRERIREILDARVGLGRLKDGGISKDAAQYHFDNGMQGQDLAIFVDLRNSTKLFSDGDKVRVSKIIRCFTSEVIDILRLNPFGEGIDPKQLEIGIRGDCVYAIYSAPLPQDAYASLLRAAYINSYIDMLNQMLRERGLYEIRVGIGISTDWEVVVKAGRKDVNVNGLVWIGAGVTLASKLSSLGNKIYPAPIVCTSEVLKRAFCYWKVYCYPRYSYVLQESRIRSVEAAYAWFSRFQYIDVQHEEYGNLCYCNFKAETFG